MERLEKLEENRPSPSYRENFLRWGADYEYDEPRVGRFGGGGVEPEPDTALTTVERNKGKFEEMKRELEARNEGLEAEVKRIQGALETQQREAEETIEEMEEKNKRIQAECDRARAALERELKEKNENMEGDVRVKTRAAMEMYQKELKTLKKGLTKKDERIHELEDMLFEAMRLLRVVDDMKEEMEATLCRISVATG